LKIKEVGTSSSGVFTIRSLRYMDDDWDWQFSLSLPNIAEQGIGMWFLFLKAGSLMTLAAWESPLSRFAPTKMGLDIIHGTSAGSNV
jgi:hypothetical protein